MSQIAEALNAINTWIGGHQYLVVSVVVPVLSAFIAWRGVVGANRSLEASLEFQRSQSILSRRQEAFRDARDALADVSAVLIDVSSSLQQFGPNPRRDERARITEKIEDLQIRFFRAIFKFNQIVNATLPLTEAFNSDIQNLKAYLNDLPEQDGGDVKRPDRAKMQFPSRALEELRKVGEKIEGLHL